MPKINIHCKVYLNIATKSAPSWSHVSLISDAMLNIDWDEGDASTRQSLIDLSEPTSGKIEVSGKIRVDRGDSNYAAIANAFASKGALDLLVLDGAHDEDGSEGVRGEFKVFSFKRDEARKGVTFRDFSFKPCVPVQDSTPPQVAVVSGGAPVLTDFGS
jgi:hypothetical protein